MTTVVLTLDKNDEAIWDATSSTYDLAALTFDDEFYSDIGNAAEGWNTCCDVLATSFHSQGRVEM